MSTKFVTFVINENRPIAIMASLTGDVNKRNRIVLDNSI